MLDLNIILLVTELTSFVRIIYCKIWKFVIEWRNEKILSFENDSQLMYHNIVYKEMFV